MAWTHGKLEFPAFKSLRSPGTRMESFGMISLQNETMNSRPFIVKSFPAHKWNAAARKSINEKQ